jgi:hypothetical protein
MAEKSKARRDADRRFEESREPVLIRLTPEEARAVDAARGETSRPQWMKAKALAAAKRAR